MPLPALVIAWLTKEAVGGGAGLLDAILYHMGYDENNWLRKLTDNLDELSTFNRLFEDWGLAPRKADTEWGEMVGNTLGLLDWFVPTGAAAKAGAAAKMLSPASQALKAGVYAARSAQIASPAGRVLFPQQYQRKPINLEVGGAQPQQGGFPAVGQFAGVGNMGDIMAQNINTAAAMYPHLWAAANAEQARRDREYRDALERSLRQYATQANQVMSMPLGYEVPAFW